MKKLTLPLRFGLLISACLIAFFLILSLFNLHTNPLFSVCNALIMGCGMYGAIHYYKLRHKGTFNYIEGATVSLTTGIIATIIFTLFFAFYSTEINPEFLSVLLQVFKGDYYVKVGLVSFVVAIMGLSTTVVLTLTFMQLFKPSYNVKYPLEKSLQIR